MSEAKPKIWFCQVKVDLLDLPLEPSDFHLIGQLVMWTLHNQDSEPVEQELFAFKDWSRFLDLGLVTDQGKLNRKYFANSKYDRDFLNPKEKVKFRR